MRSCSNIAGIYIYDILMQHQWKKRTLTVPRSQKNKYCRSKTKPGFRLGIWGLDDVWWELALRIPHSWLENWRLGVGPNPLSQPRPFCSFLGCVMPEFFFGCWPQPNVKTTWWPPWLDDLQPECDEYVTSHAIQPAAIRTCLKTHYIGTLSKIVIYMEITRAWGVPLSIYIYTWMCVYMIVCVCVCVWICDHL